MSNAKFESKSVNVLEEGVESTDGKMGVEEKYENFKSY